ncbi:AAA family ATPase [Butyrivibrio sp. AE3004]|uniref:AAA family ATPase n=1 Tax=Butyrivibrio sp. AE3004 TaxID=1506994 RepID=UPI00068D53F7|nr:AAA family ATPase [Butyrivibrio sp. AE3004]
MIILITGASHTGKTVLAQRLLEKYKYPYLSIDHLKMGLIRSGNTNLTPEDDDELTDYLWPIVCEMIKTAIENKQHMIVEGCYVSPEWKNNFTEEYLRNIRFICLAMTEDYIEEHFDDIIRYESEVESRIVEADCSIENLKQCNRWFIDAFSAAGDKITLIKDDYEKTLMEEFLQNARGGCI